MYKETKSQFGVPTRACSRSSVHAHVKVDNVKVGKWSMS
jgi:hypothetical protein